MRYFLTDDQFNVDESTIFFKFDCAPSDYPFLVVTTKTPNSLTIEIDYGKCSEDIEIIGSFESEMFEVGINSWRIFKMVTNIKEKKLLNTDILKKYYPLDFAEGRDRRELNIKRSIRLLSDVGCRELSPAFLRDRSKWR